MIGKVKVRFEGNPSHSDRKISRDLNISRERIQHILKIELGLKPLKLQKLQQLTDGEKKLHWKETRSYFACTKVASYRIWFTPMSGHSRLSSLRTNEMIGFTCQRGLLKIYTCYWPP